MKYTFRTGKRGWRKTIVAFAFMGWGMVTFFIGAALPGLGLPQSEAATSKPLVRLDDDRLAGKMLGEFEPYEPDSGNLMARGHEFYYSEDEMFGLGVWESKPGEMTYTDLEYDELMYVLEGSIVMTDPHGKSEKFGPGQGVLLPKGYTGTFTVPQGGVRKIWVTYSGGKK